MGNLNSMGYGRFYDRGKANWKTGKSRMALAHRWAWQHWRGPIPAGLCVLHQCDNPRCVEVDHLLLGSQAANMRDAKMKGRTRNQHITPI